MSSKPIERRDFLGQSSAAVAVGVTVGLAGAPTSSKACEDAPERRQGRSDAFEPHEFAHGHFCDHVGCRFAVHHEIGDEDGHDRNLATLVLVACDKQRLHRDDVRPSHTRKEPFSLLFVTSRGAKLNNAIHRVEHPELGEFKLFLNEVRSETHPHSTVFEAAFS